MKITGHWSDTNQLKRDKEKAYKFLTNNGIKPCFDSYDNKLLRLLFTPIFFALIDDIFTSDLSLVYLYRQSEQSDEFAEVDGLCNISVEYGTTSIGISAEALEYDLDYAVMVLIHEITHLLCKGTSPDFFMRMDKLLHKYNRFTTSKICNDYMEKGVRQFNLDSRSGFIGVPQKNREIFRRT